MISSFIGPTMSGDYSEAWKRTDHHLIKGVFLNLTPTEVSKFLVLSFENHNNFLYWFWNLRGIAQKLRPTTPISTSKKKDFGGVAISGTKNDTPTFAHTVLFLAPETPSCKFKRPNYLFRFAQSLEYRKISHSVSLNLIL